MAQKYALIEVVENGITTTKQVPVESKSKAKSTYPDLSMQNPPQGRGFLGMIEPPKPGKPGKNPPGGTGQGLDIASKAVKIASATLDVAKKAYVAMEKGFENIDASGILDPLNAMQDMFGMSNQAFKAMKDQSNAFVDAEMQRMIALDDAYINQTSRLSKHFKHDEFKEKYTALIVEMNNMNAMALKSFDADERERALLIGKNLEISQQETAKLLQRTYAYSGETSDKILTDIAAHSKKLSEVVGIGQKDLANEMAQVLSDTETFGNMTVEQAGRMAAAYKQLGLDLNAVKGIINGFRSFDQAAQKMGDLSAMFGIQMDAMEMMALANEDEEEFLIRMRDQMMDQGVDVENMSKTRLRALGDQLNMTQEQVQTFFRTGEMQAGQAEMEAAQAEANQETVAETVKSVQDMKRYIKMTKDEIVALGSLKTFKEKRKDMAGLAIDGDNFNVELRRTVPASQAAAKGIGMMVSNMQELTGHFTKILEQKGGAGAEGILGGIMGVTTGDMMGAFKSATGEQAEKAGESAGEGFTAAIGKYIKPSSLPLAWSGLKDGVDWIAANAGNTGDTHLGQPIAAAAAAVGAAFGKGIEEEIALNMGSIGTMITDAVNAAGPLDVDINTNVTAQVAAAAEIKAPPTVTQIDTASLAAELSGIGLKEAAEALGKLPEGITTALSTLTVTTQAAAEVEAAAVTAETLSVENSPAFKALADNLQTMATEQKTALTAISDAIKSDKTMMVDLHLNKTRIATAIKDFSFADGRKFQIHMPG